MVLRLVAVSAALVAAAPASASAKTLEVDAKVVAGLVAFEGGRYTTSGELRESGLRGGYVVNATQTGNKFAGTFRYVDAHGAMTGTNSGEVTDTSGGKISFADTLKVTGGTGSYAGAKGTLAEVGTVDPQTGFTRETAKGRLTVKPRAARKPGAPKRHRYSATMTGAPADLQGNVALVAGAVKGLTPQGGIIVGHAPQGPSATITLVYYDGLGTITAKIDIERETQPDGSVVAKLVGGGFTGGTGRYRRLKPVGKGTFTGGRDAKTGELRFEFGGTLRY